MEVFLTYTRFHSTSLAYTFTVKYLTPMFFTIPKQKTRMLKKLNKLFIIENEPFLKGEFQYTQDFNEPNYVMPIYTIFTTLILGDITHTYYTHRCLASAVAVMSVITIVKTSDVMAHPGAQCQSRGYSRSFQYST